MVATLGLVAALATGVAVADENDVPSEQEVEAAQDAAAAKARDVAAVQADLAVANDRLHRSAVVAAQAAEAHNGAVWRLKQARKAARAAEERAAAAAADVARQQAAYGDALATTYTLAPELSAISAMIAQDGVRGVVDKATAMRNAESALAARYDEFRASSTLAAIASRQAEEASATAARRRAEASTARAAAQSAAEAAAAEADAITRQKDALIAEMASLQNVSVALAEQRQSALEQAAQAAAAEAAAKAAEDEAAAAAAQAAPPAPAAPAAPPAVPEAPGAADPQPQPAPQPTPTQPPAPAPAPEPTPPPSPAPQPPPASGGAQAAIAFAKDQIGDPYRWGAAGPNAWDCSGLTMRAWARGGKSLPHYSVAQYEQSTPIRVGDLKPGDLIFWGSSSRSSSIYHVALYIGNDQIIHAPRTGRPVTQESMYYWRTPNFYARP